MLLEFFSLISAFNFLLLAVVLVFKTTASNKKNNWILAIMLINMAIYCSLVFCRYTVLNKQLIKYAVFLPPIDGLFLLSVPVCIYFYIRTLFGYPIQFRSLKTGLYLIAYIPFILFNIHFIRLTELQRYEWMKYDFKRGSIEMNLLNLVIYIQLIIFSIKCYRLVIERLKISEKVYHHGVCYNIVWLKAYLLTSMSMIFISAPICFYFHNEKISILIGVLAMDIQFVFMFFKWTLHNEVVTELYTNTESTKPEKKEICTPNEEMINKHLQSLLACMEQEKPYLDENCSIKTVSEQINIPAHLLSNILNLKLQKNFPDFINEYRIEKARKILISRITEDITIEHIASQCGFGSKSTFNRAFKKFNNDITPSEFMRQQQEKV